MSDTRPGDGDVLGALFDTINGNDFDDFLEGWWSSKVSGSDRYRINFEGSDGRLASWDVLIHITPIDLGA